MWISPTLVLAVILTGVAADAASGQRADAGKELVVGVLCPLSGPSAAGIEATQLFELVADMVNGDAPRPPMPFFRKLDGGPGVGGARVRLVFADPRGDPDRARWETERLIAVEHVHALVGAGSSSATATASQVAERLAVPFVAPESTAPALTRRGFRWFFRTSPHEEHLSQALFDFLADFQRARRVKLHTVAISYANARAAADSARVQRVHARKYGYQVVSDVAAPTTGAALYAEVRRLGALDPDVWLATTADPADARRFARTAKEIGWSPRFLVARGVEPIGTTATASPGTEVDGGLAPSAVPTDRIETSPVGQVLNAAYRARTGKDLDDRAVLAFTGMVVLLDAFHRARSTEPHAVQKALAATDLRPADLLVPWTDVRFDEQGQNVGVRAVVVQRQDGTARTVWPFPLATRELLAAIPR